MPNSLRCIGRSLAREPKGLEPKTRKREKRNRNQLGLVFSIKNGLVPPNFALDVGLESEKYKTFIRKLHILQSALKKLVIFLQRASERPIRLRLGGEVFRFFF